MQFSLSSSLILAASFLCERGALADECQPHIWSGSSILKVGEINCREDMITGPNVSPHTCESITSKYDITFDKLLRLNPGLDKECKNIKPKTPYCVVGFPEPPRAFDGLCGPRRNATCLGTDKQCCNSKTWRCGDTEEDCRPDVCYEGACLLG